MSPITQDAERAGPPGTTTGAEDSARDYELVARLLAGDQFVFDELGAAGSPVMLRLARGNASTRRPAEDVVRHAWLGVIKGLAGFHGRSSLRNWTFSILINRAKTRRRWRATTVAEPGSRSKR
jgi:DNA-directed RNA polymerase specialized sigma24 family protein